MGIEVIGAAVASGSLADEATLFLLDSPTSNELDSFLNDEENLTKFKVAISGPHMSAILTSQTAIDAIVASQTARDALLANPPAMGAVAVSQTALDTLFNSAVARSSLFDSAIAEKALRDSGFALVYLENNFATTSSGNASGFNYVNLTNQKVFVISADTGYNQDSANRKARNFVHFQDGVTSSEVTVPNDPYPGNPWPLLAGRFMDGLEIMSRDNNSTSYTRSAKYIVME